MFVAYLAAVWRAVTIAAIMLFVVVVGALLPATGSRVNVSVCMYVLMVIYGFAVACCCCCCGCNCICCMLLLLLFAFNSICEKGPIKKPQQLTK